MNLKLSRALTELLLSQQAAKRATDFKVHNFAVAKNQNETLLEKFSKK